MAKISNFIKRVLKSVCDIVLEACAKYKRFAYLNYSLAIIRILIALLILNPWRCSQSKLYSQISDSRSTDSSFKFQCETKGIQDPKYKGWKNKWSNDRKHWNHWWKIDE